MSDPTDNGQRTPLSSSTSHASGTSALSVTVQPEPPEKVTSTPAQDDAAAPASKTGGEANSPAGAEPNAQMSQPASAGSGDEPTSKQPESADQPEVVAATEFHAEQADPIAASSDTTEQASAPVDEPVYTAAVEEPGNSAGADDGAVSPNGSLPEDTRELLAIARQTTAENEARQAKALALFEQVSRRFTTALEEAGVDAARVTFKVMEFAQASLKNNLELAKSYANARSVPDIFGLHAAYLARQFELLNAQAEELREITAKMASRNSASLRSPVDPAAKALDNR